MHPDQNTPDSHRFRSPDTQDQDGAASNEAADRAPEQDQDSPAIEPDRRDAAPAAQQPPDGARVAEAGNAYVGRGDGATTSSRRPASRTATKRWTRTRRRPATTSVFPQRATLRWRSGSAGGLAPLAVRLGWRSGSAGGPARLAVPPVGAVCGPCGYRGGQTAPSVRPCSVRAS